MNRKKFRCLVDEVIDLLRQVRSDLNSESDRVLAVSIDEAIEKLERCIGADSIDNGCIDCVLKALGRGLAALPAILSLID
jgi:hypothetical protein